MSKSSRLGYASHMPAATLDAHEPVSSGRAFLVRDKLLHLTDQYSQVRCNWVSPNAEDYGIDADSSPVWSFTYPHTWLAPNKPANLDFRILAEDCDVTVRLVTAKTPLPDHDDDVTGVIFEDTYSFTGVDEFDGQWFVTAAELPGFSRGWEHFPILGSDGVSYAPRLCMMRFEVCPSAETAGRVFGVLLREFA